MLPSQQPSQQPSQMLPRSYQPSQPERPRALNRPRCRRQQRQMAGWQPRRQSKKVASRQRQRRSKNPGAPLPLNP